MGSQNYGIDPIVATQIAKDVGEIQGMGVETAIVIGGGNIFRGVAASARGMDQSKERRQPRFHHHEPPARPQYPDDFVEGPVEIPGNRRQMVEPALHHHDVAGAVGQRQDVG